MQPADLFVQLRTSLNATDSPVVLSALKSDSLVWRTLLNSETSKDLLEEPHPLLADWSPGAMALHLIGSRLKPGDLNSEPMQTIDNGLRKKALDAFETVLRSGEPVKSLEDAGLVALALRERRRKTHSWVGLTEELKGLALQKQGQVESIWETPLACLYGLIPDPEQLMRALVIGTLHPGIEWVTHIIECNPIPIESQVSLFKKTFLLLSMSDQVEWLLYLNSLGHKNILQTLAADLLIENSEIQEIVPIEFNPDRMPWSKMAALAANFESLATLHEMAGHPVQSVNYLERTRSILHHWLSGSTFQMVALNSKTGEIDNKIWDEALTLSKTLPISGKLLSETAYITNIHQTNPFLKDNDLSKNLLVGRVFQAHHRSQTGNKREAQEAAREAINYWISQVSKEKSLLSGQYVLDFQVTPLLNALVDLGLIKEAIAVGELFISVRPEDTNLLMMVSDLCHRAGNHEDALNTISQVILMEPEQIESHRILAGYLEECKSWPEALTERENILTLQFSKPIDDSLALAQCALGGHFFSEAVEICEKLIEKNPALGMAWAYLGMAHSGSGDLQNALSCLSKATLLDPENSTAWAQLAELHKRNGDYQRCMETLRSAILTSPDSAELHYALGKAYLETRSPSEALPFLRQSARLAPESDSVALDLVKTLNSLGHEQEALEVIEKARQRWPVDAGLAYQHARILLNRGEKDEGLAILDIALQSALPEPKWFVDYAKALIGPPELIWGRVNAQPEYSQIAKAQKALQRGLNSEPDHFESRLILAELLAMRQELEASFAAYHHLVEMEDAGFPQYYWRVQAGLGFVASQLNQNETALASFQNAVTARPDMISLQRALAEAYLSADLRESAGQTADDAMALAPDDVNNLEWFADLMNRIGESGRGIQALRTASQISPNNLRVLFKLAEMYIHCGEPKDAEDVILEAISKDTATHQDFRDIAAVSMRLGNQALALTALEKAIDAEPEPSDEVQFEIADLYYQMGLLEKSAKAVEAALAINPNQAKYYLLQSDLQKLDNRPQAALASLEHALRVQESKNLAVPCDDSKLLWESGITSDKDTIQVDIHVRFVHLLEKTGNLSSALYHAEQALRYEKNNNEVRYFAVDLATRLFQNERAEAILLEGFASNGVEDKLNSSDTEEDEYRAGLLSYRASFMLEKTNLSEVEKYLEEGLAIAPHHLRLLSIKVQMLQSRGESQTAQTILDQILAIIKENIGVFSTDPSKRLDSTALAVAEAAAVCFNWDSALEIFTAYMDQHPNEPLALLSYGRSFVKAAEWQSLSDDLNIKKHVAGIDLRTPAIYSNFDQAMMELRKSDRSADIERWCTRGEMIFQPTSAHNQFETPPQNAEDAAWSIAAILRSASTLGIASLVEKFPQAALVQAMAAWGARTRDIEKATTLAHRAVELSPVDPINQLILAQIAEKAGNDSEALESLEAALAIWPDEPEWQFEAARLAMKEHEPALCVDHLENAVHLEPRNQTYLKSLGWTYLQAKAFKRAESTLTLLTQAYPENEEGWVLLAQACLKGENNRQALVAAEEALKLNPKSVPALVLCGEISLARDPNKALEYVREAQALSPNDPNCRLLAARILIKNNNEKEALSELNNAVAEIPDSLDLNLERAQLVYRLEGTDAALPILKSMAVKFPQDDQVMAYLAKLFTETADFNQAEKAAVQALKLNQNQPDIHLLLGKVYHESGQLDKAIYHLSEAISNSPAPLDGLIEMGKTYTDRREYKLALVAYQKAIEVEPNDFRPYYQSALVMRDGKDYPGAETMLRKAAQLAPDDVNIRRQLGAIVALNLVQTCQEASSSCQ